MPNSFEREVAPSDEERRLELKLTTSLKDSLNRHYLHDFCCLMRTIGDHGFIMGVQAFLRVEQIERMSRWVRTALMTQLALHDTDMLLGETEEITEASVASFGRFIGALSGIEPQIAVEWAEDLNDGSPTEDGGTEHDVQTTAFIRGVLFSRSMQHLDRGQFWGMAAESERFPFRIFSDPCVWNEGVILSAFHQKVIADILSVAPLKAVARFCAHIRDEAKWRQECISVSYEHGIAKWELQNVEATMDDRLELQRGIISPINDMDRRRAVKDAFEPATVGTPA